MLEILIIISITVVLFLLLRNFSKTQSAVEEGGDKEKESKMFYFWQKWQKQRRTQQEKDIKEALESGQRSIIAPKDVEAAQATFAADDPEVAKLLYKANEALEAGDLGQVEARSIEAISIDKHCDQAYAFVAFVALEKKNLNEALEAAGTALQCNSENALAHGIIACVNFSKERYSEAVDEYKKAINLERNNPKWHAGLGRAYMEIRQFAKAAKALKRASQLDSENKEYRNLAFQAEEKQRSHSRAFRV